MKPLISLQRSVIPACDVDSLEKLAEVVCGTAWVPGIGAYKVGLELVIPFGLTSVVKVVRLHTKLPIIYDHQKAGNDIPEMGPKFAKAVKSAGADAVILFPFAGPATHCSWIKACQAEGLVVLAGGHMTHKEFLESDDGYVRDNAPSRIYTLAAEIGVTDFVVPGNKPEYVERYKKLFEHLLGHGNFQLYAPGFISQGGDISETGKVAGESWHAIVGSALYQQEGAENIKAVAQKLTAQIALP